ncbi:chromosome condensation complex Condensin, subunit G [Aspergillus melleus]|uniref:Chromosome condensation complex Condensin, subunit G n=1 Tax=Aspergillus melleus TaxID=138277 RepID=A0ACC3BEI7_9EURO|nr:chromosome condensation complex Condensin, subunit G [Aspergillus melleus]
MPSRVAARSTSGTSRKASSQPSRAGSATPSIAIPEEPSLPEAIPSLRRDVCSIFADAQRSTTGHRKLVVRLRKLQESCCGIRSSKKDGSTKVPDDVLMGEETLPEKEFNIEIGRCMLRILPIKKSEPVGDRILRFLGNFLIHASEKDAEIFAAEDDEHVPETPTARLTTSIVALVVPLLSAKDRTVRFRATQIIAHIVNSLDTVDDDLYHAIRQGLLKRIRDKESSVRVQAVMGLGRLAGNEEDDDNNDDSTALVEKLVEIMQNDTSADVRKTLLLNLPLLPNTLPYLLERARDLDAPTRRALYSRLLPTLGDFRHLSLSMREKMLRWGLRDRDESVRKATGKLFFDRWIEDVAGSTQDSEGGPIQRSPPNISALLELLERIDVVNSGVESGIAHEAMRSFWEGRPDYREAVVFDEEFWESLTGESVFLLRSFNDFCRVENEGKYESLADEKIPEVTALAYYLHNYLSALLQKKKESKDTGDANDDDCVELEFVVEQLLHVAMTLDYSDEVGRRKMYTLLRESLAVPELPQESTKLTIETLRFVCGPAVAAENEFCSVVLEAIAEVHDTITTEDSFVSAKSEISDDTASRHRSQTPGDGEPDKPFNKEEAKAKILREIVVNMKCLHIALCMLQNVQGNLQENMNLVTMLNNLVVPAVRSHEAPIRERGLECLGLCCLLDKTLAEENMTLFIHCYSKGHEALQVTAIHILCDMLTTHPSLLTPVTQSDGETIAPPLFQKPLLKVFARALKSSSPMTVQSAAATALSKLLLTNVFTPSGSNIPQAILDYNQVTIETLLSNLVVSFFHPRTRENPALRQSLAYFFPVYCHSRLDNTQHMRRVIVPVIRTVLNSAEEHYSLEAEEDSDGDIDETAGQRELKALMSGLLGMVAEWTDERRVLGLGGEKVLTGASASPNVCGFVHLGLVKDILERVLGISEGPNRCSKDEKKLLFSLMSKLYISPPTVPSRSSSRNPEGDDPFRSSVRSAQADISTDNAQLAQEVKELLDETIEEGLAAEASGRNALVKVKNAVLKILAIAQGARPPSVRPKDEGEEGDSDMMSVRSGSVRSNSVRPSVEPGVRRRGMSIEPSIMEEDENEDSRHTIIKSEVIEEEDEE